MSIKKQNKSLLFALLLFWSGANAYEACYKSAKPIASCNNQEIVLTLSNGEKRYFCSLDTFAKVFDTVKDFISISAKDFKTHAFIDAKNAFYLTNSSVDGGYSRYSKLAFKEKSDAQEYRQKYGGDIRSFDFALYMGGRDFDSFQESFEYKQELKRGKNLYEKICKKTEIPHGSAYEIATYIRSNDTCLEMGEILLYSVSNYLTNTDTLEESHRHVLDVPEDAKCPVCGMFVYKYKKWAAKGVSSDGMEYYFDGAKDMFKYYFANLSTIHTLIVSDYYTLEAIDAKKAYYVIGSDIIGPMGHELIPFLSKSQAELFLKEHNGAMILGFDNVGEMLPGNLDSGIFQN